MQELWRSEHHASTRPDSHHVARRPDPQNRERRWNADPSVSFRACTGRWRGLARCVARQLGGFGRLRYPWSWTAQWSRFREDRFTQGGHVETQTRVLAKEWDPL